MAANQNLNVGTRVVAWCYDPTLTPTFGAYEEGVITDIYQDELYGYWERPQSIDIYRISFPDQKDYLGNPRIMNHTEGAIRVVDENHTVRDRQSELYHTFMAGDDPQEA